MHWLRKNWRRLALANAASFALQGAVLSTLLWVGMAAAPAIVLAKGASWGSFALQVALCRK